MSDVWKCAGCGVEGFDTDRRCDCATNIVCRGKEGATKTGPSWAKMRIEELEAKLAKAEIIIRIVASDKWDERLGEAVDLSCEYLAELKGETS